MDSKLTYIYNKSFLVDSLLEKTFMNMVYNDNDTDFFHLYEQLICQVTYDNNLDYTFLHHFKIIRTPEEENQ